jgi:hypothetical protein
MNMEQQTMRTDCVVHDASNRVVKQRLLWFKEYASLGNVKEECWKFGNNRKTFYLEDSQEALISGEHARYNVGR